MRLHLRGNKRSLHLLSCDLATEGTLMKARPVPSPGIELPPSPIVSEVLVHPPFQRILNYIPGKVPISRLVLRVDRAEPRGIGSMNFCFLTNVLAEEREVHFHVNYYLTVESTRRKSVFQSNNWPTPGMEFVPESLVLIERRSAQGRLYFAPNAPGTWWNGDGVCLHRYVPSEYAVQQAQANGRNAPL